MAYQTFETIDSKKWELPQKGEDETVWCSQSGSSSSWKIVHPVLATNYCQGIRGIWGIWSTDDDALTFDRTTYLCTPPVLCSYLNLLHNPQRWWWGPWDCIPCPHVGTLLSLLFSITCFFNWHTAQNHSSPFIGEEGRFTVMSSVSDSGPGHRQSCGVRRHEDIKWLKRSRAHCGVSNSDVSPSFGWKLI